MPLSPIVLSMVRKRAMYNIAMNWMVIPMLKERLRPIKSTRKKAQRRALMNLTRPKIPVASSFSCVPVVPMRAKY